MLADTIMNRITELREQKGVSEREMSIALGKSPNYLYFMKKIHPDMEKNFSIYNHVFRNIEHELRKSFSEEQLLSFSEILRAISQYDWKDIGNEQGT